VLSLLTSAGLPSPETQCVVDHDGSFVARVDLAYPDILLAIEVDGYRYHSSRAAWQADLDRQNRLMSLGWTILRFTKDDVTFRPRLLVARVRDLHARLSAGCRVA
jgi:very-short-patch-repair endonuclease